MDRQPARQDDFLLGARPTILRPFVSMFSGQFDHSAAGCILRQGPTRHLRLMTGPALTSAARLIFSGVGISSKKRPDLPLGGQQAHSSVDRILR